MIKNKRAITSAACICSTPEDFTHLKTEGAVLSRAIFTKELYPKEDHLAVCIKLSDLASATQNYLTEIVSGMAMLNPLLRNELHVTTRSLTPQFSLTHTDSVWVPPYPVVGYLTKEPLGFSFNDRPIVTIPCVELLVGRDDEKNAAFALALKVARYDQLELLFQLMREASEFWSDYESAYKITPSSANPLDNDFANVLAGLDSHTYAQALLEQFKGYPSALENFSLDFNQAKGESSQGAIVAAVVILNGLYALEEMGGKAKTATKRKALLGQMKTLLVSVDGQG